MPARTGLPPDLARPDMGAVLFGFWRVDPAHQDDAVDALGGVWADEPWPAPGMDFYSLLVGEDGESLLHYAQFTRVDVVPDSAWKAAIDTVAPGSERVEVTTARWYRSTERLPDAPRPGCYALVMVTLDTPGPDQQEAWVDGVFDAGGSTPPPESGLIAANFYLSADGTRILNLAEWTTAEAHRRAAEEPAPRLRAATQRPGVRDIEVSRYRFAFSLVPGEPAPDLDVSP